MQMFGPITSGCYCKVTTVGKVVVAVVVLVVIVFVDNICCPWGKDAVLFIVFSYYSIYSYDGLIQGGL